MNECLGTLNETNRAMHRNKVLCTLDVLEGGAPFENSKEFLGASRSIPLSHSLLTTFEEMNCNIFHWKLLPFSRSYSNKLDSLERIDFNEWSIMKIYEKWGATVFNWKVSLFLLLRCYRTAKQHFLLCRLVKMRNCIKLSIFIVIAFFRADTARPGFVS